MPRYNKFPEKKNVLLLSYLKVNKDEKIPHELHGARATN